MRDLKIGHYEFQTDTGPKDWVIYCTMKQEFDLNRTDEFHLVECADCLRKMITNGYEPMTTKRTAREFWIDPDDNFAAENNFGGRAIHVREVLPDEISDTERLFDRITKELKGITKFEGNKIVSVSEWLIKNKERILDAAIREGKQS